jgi:hypothetical protein
MSPFINFLRVGAPLYIAVVLFCCLFAKKRNPAQIQARRARQTPIYAALAGVLGGDAASILFSFYTRSPIPVSLLWGIRFIFLGVFSRIYGTDAFSLEGNGPSLPVIFGYFFAAFTSMYISAVIIRAKARPLTKAL